MGIDLDITEGDWEAEGWAVFGTYKSIGPIESYINHPGLYIENKDDAIATLCVPQFKDVADAMDEFVDGCGPDLHSGIAKYKPLGLEPHVINKLRDELKKLKDRIKELKGQ